MIKNKAYIFTFVVYVTSMTVLLIAVYRFLENWKMNEFSVFIVASLVCVVAIGWGYVLSMIIFTPAKQIESSVMSMTNDVMHELNIPLSTIRANTSMLKKSLEDTKSITRLQRIEDATLRLEKLYNELRYTLQKEIHEVPKEVFDVKTLIASRVEIFAEQKRNPFDLALQSYMIKADKIGFEQMIDNLLSNAIKYSEKNALIFISLNNGKLCIKDKGRGMSTSELLRVHERYFQADVTQEGKGIGLSLVKRYCEDEKIEICIESEKDRGTTICLTLKSYVC